MWSAARSNESTAPCRNPRTGGAPASSSSPPMSACAWVTPKPIWVNTTASRCDGGLPAPCRAPYPKEQPMSGPVHYNSKDSIAVIRMDDGKVNALGPTMQEALNEAIDQADRDNAGALVITGNERVFSGGFDLKVLTSGEAQPAIDMLRGGFELAHRLLSYPKPVVMACTGHAIAMGAFLLTSGDHRVAAPAYNIQANEVAIGMTIPD